MKKLTVFVFTLLAILCLAPSALAEDYLYTAGITGRVSVYLSPNEKSHKVMEIPACSEVELLEKDHTWALIKYQKKSGWINVSFTRSSYKKAAEATGSDAEKKGTVVSENGYITAYNVPGEEGAVVKEKIADGMVVEIKRETSDGWGLMTENDGKDYSWIRMENILPFEEETIKYGDVEFVYVLSKDGKGAPLWSDVRKTFRKALIPDCVKLTVRKRDEGFAYVSYGGSGGWIEYTNTTNSLFNAQNQAGTAVNKEYIVAGEGGKIDIYSVPSGDSASRTKSLAKINDGTEVYVLRSTATGWCLINHNGTVGWVSSEYLTKAEEKEASMAQLLEKPRVGFVCTEDCEGLQMYASAEDEYETTIMPECVAVSVIAEEGNFEYIQNGYASGWVKKGNLSDTYVNALAFNIMEDTLAHRVTKTTRVMSHPTYSEKCESEELAKVKKGTNIKVIKIVETGDSDWGLIKIRGVEGWVNLDDAERTEIVFTDIIIVVAIVAGLLVITFSIVYFRKRREKALPAKKKKGKKKTDSETVEGEVEENEGIHTQGSVVDTETSDVSGK